MIGWIDLLLYAYYSLTTKHSAIDTKLTSSPPLGFSFIAEARHVNTFAGKLSYTFIFSVGDVENPPPTTLSASSGQTASAVPVEPGGMVTPFEITCTIWMFCIAPAIAPLTKFLMSSPEGIIVPFTTSSANLVVVSGTSLVVAYVGTSSEVALIEVNATIIPITSFDVNSSICLIIIMQEMKN